jgi:hypothetical protein
MPLEQHAEGVRVAVDMKAQQFFVGRAAIVSLGSRSQSMVGRQTWLGQGVALGRLLVRFRRFLPPPW